MLFVIMWNTVSLCPFLSERSKKDSKNQRNSTQETIDEKGEKDYNYGDIE